jgi:hypothetical protein
MTTPYTHRTMTHLHMLAEQRCIPRDVGSVPKRELIRALEAWDEDIRNSKRIKLNDGSSSSVDANANANANANADADADADADAARITTTIIDDSQAKQVACPVCCTTMLAIFQCTEGHAVCRSCCARVNTCPQCKAAWPDKPIRNRLAENLFANLVVPCPHVGTDETDATSGCVFRGKYADMPAHVANSCGWSAPPECPFKACTTTFASTDALLEHLNGSTHQMGPMVTTPTRAPDGSLTFTFSSDSTTSQHFPFRHQRCTFLLSAQKTADADVCSIRLLPISQGKLRLNAMHTQPTTMRVTVRESANHAAVEQTVTGILHRRGKWDPLRVFCHAASRATDTAPYVYNVGVTFPLVAADIVETH